MPSWDKVQAEIHNAGSAFDIKRRFYVEELARYTGRNVIIYYSGWLEKEALLRQGLTGAEVNDGDKNAFMATIHKLDRSNGLDLVLHTPGGNVAATESLVDYLRVMFNGDIRVIVPQLAMSAGTMIALAAKTIIMGKHSSLGPIDPQINGTAAHGIVEEFNKARSEIAADASAVAIWQPIIAKYPPTLVGECQKAIAWADNIVKTWLMTGMFSDRPDPERDAERVITELGDHALTLSHDRHISAAKATSLGLEVEMLESDEELQEKVLTVHHACAQTLASTPAFKIVENHEGVSYITSVNARPAD
ncbi:SDH family Clp fold serine proteinase [Ruania halotolerans]|uniref:SDH family Clp fold serine proteinase n=1 Tax=Ruania halotolerans TaxID=2897773 RepID=UPI001E5A9979|nr:ATP-dependent Clp protease proteolytic subunit [Ruania halotolerans]UFU05490.1 ATP-dependent Clp protease proteolytic subunit [Ruania halotolerans]